MQTELTFKLKLNDNEENIVVVPGNENDFVVSFDTTEMAAIKKNDAGKWVQTHGGNLPDNFIEELGKHIEARYY